MLCLRAGPSSKAADSVWGTVPPKESGVASWAPRVQGDGCASERVSEGRELHVREVRGHAAAIRGQPAR